MSEFVNRTKISALERSNAELMSENSDLKTEISKLKAEISRLGADAPDIIELEEVVLQDVDLTEINQLHKELADYHRKEDELQDLISSVSVKIRSPEKRHQAVQDLLAALQVEASETMADLVDQYQQKKRSTNSTIAFLLGILMTLVVWVGIAYQNVWQSYLPFLK